MIEADKMTAQERAKLTRKIEMETEENSERFTRFSLRKVNRMAQDCGVSYGEMVNRLDKKALERQYREWQQKYSKKYGKKARAAGDAL